ncbi:MAG: tetratricopeptide repeat protein [Acidobacteriota bacterium]
MDDHKGIQSDCTESKKDEGSNSGNFFKKYRLLMPREGDGSNQRIFKKYVPPSMSSDEGNADRQSAEELNLADVSSTGEQIPKDERRRASVYLWWGLVSAILLLVGGMTVQLVRHTQARSTRQAETTTTPSAPETPYDVTTRPELSSSIPSGLLESASAGSLDGNHTSKSVRSLRLPISSFDFQRNVMVARAREFEDRGMLPEAEQEYRAIASSFPDDTFGQFGLRRVQSLLSAMRQREASRISREVGLRKFRMSDYNGAERDLTDAVNAGRTDTSTLYALGMCSLKLGYYVNARTALQRCIEASPDYAPALVGLAQTSAATGREDESLSLLQRALELGGGAEFTPAKIKEMISMLAPKTPSPSASARSLTPPPRLQPSFFARAVHGHSFPLTWCTGELEIVNSVVHFNATNPSHSFHVLSSGITRARVAGNVLHFDLNGKDYSLTLKGRPARDFLGALGGDN